MTLNRALVAVFVVMLALIVGMYTLGYHAVPHCKIVDGREIVDHHCIPYCPPDPKECE